MALLCGAAPAGFRLSSLALHLASVLVFRRLAARLLKDDAAALAAALLFALFPMHVELMAVATFKTHLVVGLCGLLMLELCFSPRRWAPAAQAALLALALLAKETAVGLPLLVAALKAAVPAARRDARQERRLFAGLAAMLAAYLAFRLAAAPRSVPPIIGTPAAHLLTSAKCLLWYAASLALPSPSLEHGLAKVQNALSWEGAAVAAGCAALLAAGAAAWRRDRLLGLAAAWVLLALLPFLNLFPFLNLSLVADRYLYLAAAGAALAAARTLWFLPRAAALAAAALLAAACAGVGSRHLGRFMRPLELWERAAAEAPNSPRAQLAYAFELGRAGNAAAAQARLLDVERRFPDYAGAARLRRGVLYASSGHPEKGLPLLLDPEARRLDPVEADLGAGTALLLTKQPARALEVFERARALAPRRAELLVPIGQAQWALGRRAEARRSWESAAAYPPVRALALASLGHLALDEGRREDARRLFEESLRLDPAQPDARRALRDVTAR